MWLNKNLLFLYNDLIDPDVKEKLRLPLEFVSFAIVDGKMYSHYADNGVFITPLGIDKDWGNTKVYGGLFICKDISYYYSLLDAYHACSMYNLRRNHFMDLHHRVSIKATPIYFDNLDELSRLKYREGGEIDAITYIGNTDHSRIYKRFLTTQSYRLVDGILPKQFRKLYKGVV